MCLGGMGTEQFDRRIISAGYVGLTSVGSSVRAVSLGLHTQGFACIHMRFVLVYLMYYYKMNWQLKNDEQSYYFHRFFVYCYF